MLISEWIGLTGLLAANAGVNIGIYKYFNSKLDTVWKRFDEHKNKIEETYVRRDSCQLLHASTADNLKGLEIRIDKRFDKLEAQITQLLNK
jgi:hypothetical protein